MTSVPLQGKIIADFSQGAAGPYCAMLLGDLGGDVIKIEPPAGDWGRTLGSSHIAKESSSHFALNRNKRSVSVDMKTEEGLQIAKSIAESADIVIQNFRRGVMDDFGLGYEQLAKKNPSLIYATIYGFGPDGPCADLPAGDSIMQAFGGLMSINGDRDTPPLRMGNVVSDMLAGMFLTQAIFTSLYMLEKTGRGQLVSVSLLDALVAFQAAPISEFFMTGKLPERRGREHPLMSPSGIYEVKDGYVSISVLQHHWIEFCRRMDIEEIALDPRFKDNDQRRKNRAELMEILQPMFKNKTAAEVAQLAEDNDLQCAIVNDYKTLSAHPQVINNDLFVDVEHETVGHTTVIRHPVRYESIPIAYRPPPMLGEHSAEVLEQMLGVPQATIKGLIERKIIKVPVGLGG
jgi:crotonobetainyl-CoA:carnitine CoA-transferase CaiB-like acyl-CoA transferase